MEKITIRCLRFCALTRAMERSAAVAALVLWARAASGGAALRITAVGLPPAGFGWLGWLLGRVAAPSDWDMRRLLFGFNFSRYLREFNVQCSRSKVQCCPSLCTWAALDFGL